MLTGRRAFKGEDVADTLAAVLRQDVDWTALPASTPAPVRRLLARCLDRDVKRRLRDIGEARIVLAIPLTLARRETQRRVAARAGAAPVATRDSGRALRDRGRGPGRDRRVVLGLKPSPPLTVTRFPFTLPEGQTFRRPATRHLIDTVAGRHADGVRGQRPAVSSVDVRAGREGDSRHRRLSGRDRSRLFARWPIGRLLRACGSDAQEDRGHGRSGRRRLPGRHPCSA